jgi:hypothetical protein
MPWSYGIRNPVIMADDTFRLFQSQGTFGDFSGAIDNVEVSTTCKPFYVGVYLYEYDFANTAVE